MIKTTYPDVFDNDAIFPVKFAVFSTCCVAAMLPTDPSDDELIDIAVSYSREVEHSQKT